MYTLAQIKLMLHIILKNTVHFSLLVCVVEVRLSITSPSRWSRSDWGSGRRLLPGRGSCHPNRETWNNLLPLGPATYQTLKRRGGKQIMNTLFHSSSFVFLRRRMCLQFSFQLSLTIIINLQLIMSWCKSFQNARCSISESIMQTSSIHHV